MGRNPVSAVAVAMIALSVASSVFAAEGDTRATREREMLRRTQEALRESQAQSAELSAQKAAAERAADEKLKAAAAQLDSARSTSRSAQAALHAQLESAASAQADLTRRLADANRQIAQLTSQQQEAAERLKRSQQELEASKAGSASCETKNLRLYQYSQELVTRYRQKGVWAALAQKEPVTGIREVGVENLLQEYREKLDSQRIKPAAQP